MCYKLYVMSSKFKLRVCVRYDVERITHNLKLLTFQYYFKNSTEILFFVSKSFSLAKA